MKPNKKYGFKPASPATVRPSVGSAQPMAASTPSRRTTPELPSLPPPEIRENAEAFSLPSPVPASALAVVSPTSRTTDAANSSLVQRVPKTYRHIAGRCSIHPHSENRDKNSKERPKKQIPKAKADGPKNNTPKPKAGGTSPQDAVSMQPSTSAEASRKQSTITKSSRGGKRKHLPEARGNAELSPSQPVKQRYIEFEVDQIGVLVLNLDQLQQQVSNAGRDNPPVNMESIPARIDGINDQDPPPAENLDNTTNDSLSEKDTPKTKKCMIM